MKISRENYEIWFTDWLDNNLTGSQIEEMNYFLDQNPDLREEFSELCTYSLKPVSSSFKGKSFLRKNPGDITSAQFELICAASAESDLTAEQEAEMEEMISADPQKGKTLLLYKKLKLTAPAVKYNDKNKLYRTPASRKIVRFAWAGLSAAAVVAILLMTGIFRQKESPENNPVIASENPVVQSTPEPGRPGRQETVKQEEKEMPHKTTAPGKAEKAQTEKIHIDYAIEREAAVPPEKIAYNVFPNLSGSTAEQSLIAWIPGQDQHSYEEIYDERSNVGRFVARVFRSKLLNEGEPSDARLKGYEIAEAGIEGLNKLLGWEMALSPVTDENGDLKSLKFNSRMLKFNTPVKNNESAE